MADVNRRAVLVLAVSVVLIGAGISLIALDRADQYPDDTLVIQTIGPIGSYLRFGLVADDGPESVQVESAGVEAATDALVRKDADAGLVSITRAADIANRNPDMRIIPRYVLLPVDVAGLYVPADSATETLADLGGGSLAIPDQHDWQITARISLEEQGNLSNESVDLVFYPDIGQFFRPQASQDGARYLFGYPDEDSVRTLSHPLSYLRDRFGAAPPIYVVVVSDPAHADFGFRVADALDASSRFGNANIDLVRSSIGVIRSPRHERRLFERMAAAADEDGDGTNIVPMTPQAMASGQAVLDYGADNRIIPPMNLSARTVEQ